MFSIILIIILNIWITNAQQCQFPNQRCLCITTSPMCRCASITTQSTLNFSLSYKSHLVLMQGLGCAPCPSSCLQCMSSTVCMSCLDEFTLWNNTCKPCPTNCRKCTYTPSSIPTCTECILTYYLDSRLQCQLCPLQGSLQCTSQTIQSCLGSYWLDNNGANCIKCDTYCKVCSSTTKCLTCIDGYYVSQYRCVKCKDQCATCTTGIGCVKCKNIGQYYDGSCSKCNNGCLECSNYTTCITCNTSISPNQLLTATGTCQPYPTPTDPNCLTYKPSPLPSVFPTCLKCKPDYFQQLNTTKCYYGCSLLCKQCNGAHYGLCTVCAENSYLYNRHCLPRNNVYSGTGFQVFVNAYGGGIGVVEGFAIVDRLSNTCLGESVIYSIGSASSIVMNFNNLQAYRLQIFWKIYLTSPNTSPSPSLKNYSIKFYSSSSPETYNLILQQQFSCLQKSLTDPNCTNICISKQNIDIRTKIRQFNKIVIQTDANMSVSVSVGQVLVVGYRCGGVEGKECLECDEINMCVRCVNPLYYILAQSCIQQCPPTYYIDQLSRKCYKVCPPSTYPTQTPPTCTQCPPQCLTCNSPTSCLSCSPSYYLFQPSLSCLTECPTRYFPNQYLHKCQKCSYPCYQCISNRQCTSCMFGFLDQELYTCVSGCRRGYYGRLESRMCEKCDIACNACQYASGTCLGCAVGYVQLDMQCLVNCPIGYYEKNGICTLCNTYCKNCINQTHCLQCQTGYLYQFQCLSLCPTSYYPSPILNKCQPCPQNCTSCTNQTHCLQCLSPTSLNTLTQSCNSVCPYLHYPSPQSLTILSIQTYICKRCQSPCFQCVNQTYCLSCNDRLYLMEDSGLCVQQCPSGMEGMQVGVWKCVKCREGCAACENGVCSGCVSGYVLSNGQCLTQCGIHYYKDQSTNTCTLCPYTCQTCLSPTICQTCTNPLYLLQSSSTCHQSCPPSLIPSLPPLRICQPCPIQCSQCSRNNTQIICSICSIGYYLSYGKCVMECQSGMFGVAGVCYKCQLPCRMCVGVGECVSCVDGYGWGFGGDCVVECPVGYYPMKNVTFGAMCQKCGQGCLKCQSISICQQCRPPLLLHFPTSSCISPQTCQSLPHFYPSIPQSKCLQCSASCLSCTNQPQNCTQCSSGYILSTTSAFAKYECVDVCQNGYYQKDGRCTMCGDGCARCRGDGVCVQCGTGVLYVYGVGDARCLMECPLGYYGNGRVCLKCRFPCLQCNSSSYCTKCGDEYIIHSPSLGIQTCLLSCPIGYYKHSPLSSSSLPTLPSNSSLQCLQCPQNCLQCPNQSQCTTCSPTHILLNNTCHLQCPNSTFKYYGICVNCMYGCSQCSAIDRCESCIVGIGFLYNGQCVKECPYGLIPVGDGDGVGGCQQCQASCKSCQISKEMCSSCHAPLYLYLYKCVQKCLPGSYPSQQLKQCLTCSKPCQTCQNSYSCSTCIYGYILYKQKQRNQCVQGQTCPNSYFLDVTNNYCRLQCSSQQYSDLISRTCQHKCPSIYTAYTANMTCLLSCPSLQNMYINQHTQCTAYKTDTQYLRSRLPNMVCQDVQENGYLVIRCLFSVEMDFGGGGGVGDVEVEGLEVVGVRVGSDRKNVRIYVLEKEGNGKFVNKWVKLQFKARYALRSLASVSSTFIGSRILQSGISYPLQNPQSSLLIPLHIFYTSQQHQTSLYLNQLSKSITIASFIIWLFSIIKNKKSVAVVCIVGLQWLYLISLQQGRTVSVQVRGLLAGFCGSMGVGMWNKGDGAVVGVGKVRYELQSPYDLRDFGSIGVPVVVVVVGFVGVGLMLWISRIICDKLGKVYEEYKKKQQQQQQQQVEQDRSSSNENTSSHKSQPKEEEQNNQQQQQQINNNQEKEQQNQQGRQQNQQCEQQKQPKQVAKKQQKQQVNKTDKKDKKDNKDKKDKTDKKDNKKVAYKQLQIGSDQKSATGSKSSQQNQKTVPVSTLSLQLPTNPFQSTSKKLTILLNRFTTTYPQHILLLISTPTSTLFSIQLQLHSSPSTSPPSPSTSPTGIIISSILVLAIIAYFCYTVRQFVRDRAKMGYFVKQSYKYCIIGVVDGWVIGVVAVFAGRDMFYGVSVGIAVVWLYIGWGVWRAGDWRLTSWALMQITKISIIGSLVALQTMAVQSQSNFMFSIGWIPTILIITYTIILSISASRDLFQQQSLAFKQLYQKTIKKIPSPSASGVVSPSSPISSPFLYTGTTLDIIKYQSEESFFQDQEEVQHTDDQYEESYTRTYERSQYSYRDTYIGKEGKMGEEGIREGEGEGEQSFGNYGKRSSNAARNLVKLSKKQ